MTAWNRPVRFSGPPEVRAANRDTHRWVQPAPDETFECMECGAKSWHAAAEYPCGTEPPRENVELRTPGRQAPPPRRDLDG